MPAASGVALLTFDWRKQQIKYPCKPGYKYHSQYPGRLLATIGFVRTGDEDNRQQPDKGAEEESEKRENAHNKFHVVTSGFLAISYQLSVISYRWWSLPNLQSDSAITGPINKCNIYQWFAWIAVLANVANRPQIGVGHDCLACDEQARVALFLIGSRCNRLLAGCLAE